MNNNLYKTTISNIRWIAYDIPGNIGWITYIVCLIKGRKLSAIKRVSELIPGIMMIIGVIELISERIVGLDRILTKARLYRGLGMLTFGGLAGMAITVTGVMKKEKRSEFMFGGGLLCAVFAGLLFQGYKKE